MVNVTNVINVINVINASTPDVFQKSENTSIIYPSYPSDYNTLPHINSVSAYRTMNKER